MGAIAGKLFAVGAALLAVAVVTPARAGDLREITWEELDDRAAGGTVDCNGNGIDDDIEKGQGSPDTDGDGLLDECEVLVGDFNDDDVVTALDGQIISRLVGVIEGIDLEYRSDADFDENHRIDQNDIDLWLAKTGLSVCEDGIDNDADGDADSADADCDQPRHDER
jgi:hypothetical protein